MTAAYLGQSMVFHLFAGKITSQIDKMSTHPKSVTHNTVCYRGQLCQGEKRSENSAIDRSYSPGVCAGWKENLCGYENHSRRHVNHPQKPPSEQVER